MAAAMVTPILATGGISHSTDAASTLAAAAASPAETGAAHRILRRGRGLSGRLSPVNQRPPMR
jgi:hypothetical protein